MIVLAGELLLQAESLLKQGLHVADITRGFEMALKQALEILKGWKR